QQLLDHLPVAIKTPRLILNFAVVLQAQPLHAVDDRPYRRRRGTLAVGIFNAQHETTVVLARMQPGIQCRARAADMQITGGTGSETGNDGHERFSMEIKELPV